jgi:hypothetical protein
MISGPTKTIPAPLDGFKLGSGVGTYPATCQPTTKNVGTYPTYDPVSVPGLLQHLHFWKSRILCSQSFTGIIPDWQCTISLKHSM